MRKRVQYSIRDITQVSLGCAWMILCAWITVPSIVPFTLQTLGLFCVLQVLGAEKGSLCVGLYLAMGALGIPVFSGFSGGLGVLFGPTGGFLFGFAAVCGSYALFARGEASPWRKTAALAAGMLACYALGCLQYAAVMHVPAWMALSVGVIPFILPDGIKLLLSRGISRTLKKAMKG